eukprot:COSAG02_NODE_1540_length_12016_cov_20.828480_5_plen_93_part_00
MRHADAFRRVSAAGPPAAPDHAARARVVRRVGSPDTSISTQHVERDGGWSDGRNSKGTGTGSASLPFVGYASKACCERCCARGCALVAARRQ